MNSIRRRVGAAFAALLVIFLALVVVQLVVGDNLQQQQRAHTERLLRARDANRAVLQHMTDAETGVRGFQLTGEASFLDPYDDGRKGAFLSFDVIERASSDPQVRGHLTAERRAASQWLYAYAIPIVNAGVADRDEPRAARGKQLFDDIRSTNADVEAAVTAELARVSLADRRKVATSQLVFAILAVLFLVIALVLAGLHQRKLLVPLDNLHRTLLRLSGGDRSARAVPSGPGELRAVAESLNALAAQTERLLDAEQARSVRNELRQAVAGQIRGSGDPERTARRLAEMIGLAMACDAVHSRVVLRPGHAIDVCWPAGAAPLDARTAGAIVTAPPGEVVDGGHTIAVALGGDQDCDPGLIHLVRGDDRPPFSGDDRRLLVALTREVDHAVRQQRLQHRQARLIEDLRALDERKDAFVSTVTHELRTPLTSILGYTEMLSDGDGGELSPLQQRGVTAILRNAHRLQDTVSDLLLLDPAASRADANAAGPVDLAAVLAGAQAEVDAAARAKGLEVSVDAAPVWVTGDARQLARAVANLLDNAVKFTRPGGRVTCRLDDVDGTARLVVTDTGIGIPADDLPGLFTPFHRAANAMDQAVQGSGLGLAIVHNIVGEHGGAIGVESRPDAGSTFTITMPVAAPAEAAARSGRR